MIMVLRCEDIFWCVRCDQAQGHESMHSGTKDGRRTVWGDLSHAERDGTTEQPTENSSQQSR